MCFQCWRLLNSSYLFSMSKVYFTSSYVFSMLKVTLIHPMCFRCWRLPNFILCVFSVERLSYFILCFLNVEGYLTSSFVLLMLKDYLISSYVFSSFWCEGKHVVKKLKIVTMKNTDKRAKQIVKSKIKITHSCMISWKESISRHLIYIHYFYANKTILQLCFTL